MDSFSKGTGQVLRRARLRRGLTLRDLSTLSKGRFKPSVVGGYERGERAISLQRFCELAELYGIPPDRLLAEVLGALAPEGRDEIIIDLTRLSQVHEPERDAVAEFIDQLRARRRDYLSEIVTLRAGDVEALALERRVRPARLLTQLRPALVERAPEDT